MVSSLARVGLVQAWVQLGHDGLAQGAGCPLQVREIYDSWRSEDHQCYREELTAVDSEIGRADLVLVFGHNLSLSGKTAQTLSDITRREYEDLGQSLGLVIISDTNTSLDKFATVRVNQSPDLALERLQEMMDITSLPTVAPLITITEPAVDVAEVRVILFRECERRGRKLLFDSTAVERVEMLEGPAEDDLWTEIGDGVGFRYLPRINM